MRNARKLASAVSAILIGLSCTPSTTSASTCEDVLSSAYTCSYVADDHTSGQFGATVTNPVLGDGKFDLLIGGVYLHHCTCSTSGSPLAPTFGSGKKSFFCNENTTGSMGTVRRGQILGQTYNTSGVGQRTSYICTTGVPPPPPPPLDGYCCELSASIENNTECTMVQNPNYSGCALKIANEACSGTGTCALRAKPGACCDLTSSGGSCVANVSAGGCSGFNGIFHGNSVCTVNGCVP